jgi:hypothetical protein
VVSYILVSLSDNLLINFGENIARKEETVVGLFQSAVIFDFLMNLYKLGLKLKLNNTSNRRHHYISSTSFSNNPQSNTNPNKSKITAL